MSTIRCVYSFAPSFPASDQHPDAVRYGVAGKVVDAIGGEPTAEDVVAFLAPSAQEAAEAEAHAEAKADAVVQYLRDHTPAECEDYVQANVTDLASARALMKKFAVVLCVLAKQSLR